MASDLRVCALPAPDGIVPLTIRVSRIPGVEVGAVEWPSTQPGRLPGSKDLSPVYAGAIRVLVPMTFAGPPGAGDLTAEVTVDYQAFSDSRRLPPSSVKLSLGIKELAMVDRTLPLTPGG